MHLNQDLHPTHASTRLSIQTGLYIVLAAAHIVTPVYNYKYLPGKLCCM